MANFFYRFRPTDALLEKFQELEKQEIYFARQNELNDPLEGSTNLFWRGDQILWQNLLNHYLMCLMLTVTIAVVAGRDHAFTEDESCVFNTEESLPTPELKGLYHRICGLFFQHEDTMQLPVLFSQRRSPIGRNELAVHFMTFHLHALNAVFTAMEEYCLIPCRPENHPLRAASKRPIPCKTLLEGFNSLELEYPDRPGIAEVFGETSNSIVMQMELIYGCNGAFSECGPAWHTITCEFPKRHVRQLERLLYSDSYTACFVESPTDSAMWGNYGDGHKGMCLKFRAYPNTSGKPAIKLRQINGCRGDKNGSVPTYGYIEHEFYTVQYETQFAEIDFFRSLGRLNRFALHYWYKDCDGNTSPYVQDILSGSASWREQYWNDFTRVMTTKSMDWDHENEHRLILDGSFTDFAEKSSRKLLYNFEDLQGLIFGMKTPEAEKAKIIHIIEEKCREAGRTDFEFYQACYSPSTDKMDMTRMDLIKFI